MKTVPKKAVHTIRMKINDEVREIKPGTQFNCPVGEIEYLERSGAITDPKETTAIEVVDTPPAEAPADSSSEGEAVEQEPATESEAPNLDEMTESELLAYGDKIGVKVRRTMKVETIREKIKAHLAAEAGDDLL